MCINKLNLQSYKLLKLSNKCSEVFLSGIKSKYKIALNECINNKQYNNTMVLHLTVAQKPRHYLIYIIILLAYVQITTVNSAHNSNNITYHTKSKN